MELRRFAKTAAADKRKGQGAENIPYGPADGISLDVQGTYTRFEGRGRNRRMLYQDVVPSNIKASVEMGVVSISDRGHDMMLTVRLEDMAMVMTAAYESVRKAEMEGKADDEKKNPVHEAPRADSDGAGTAPEGAGENTSRRQEDGSSECPESL